MLKTGLVNRVLTAVLGFAGVLSSACDTTSAAPAYGPPGVYFTGVVRSSSDSSAVKGIKLTAATPESLLVAEPAYTDEFGEYNLFFELEEQDSVIVTALDIDGEENGSFSSSDSTVTVPGTESEIFIDFYLEPEGD